MKWLIITVVLCFPLLLQAQTDTSFRYWNATLHVGPNLSGTSRNLEEAMIAAGFREKTGGLFGGSSGGNATGMARENPVFQGGIERVTARTWSYTLLLSSLSGHVEGFSAAYGDLRIEYAQTATSFLVGYHSKRRTSRVAAGPSLHFTTLKTASYSASLPVNDNKTKAGFAIEAGFRFPAKSRFFFDFNTQYQWVGRQDLGVYRFGQTGDVQIGEKPTSYLCFNFGLGLRWGGLPN